MMDRTNEVLRTFPPRPLNPDERELVGEWFAATGDVTSAFISERRGDDPAMYRRIVIALGPGREPSYLVHAPMGMSCWLVFVPRGDSEVHRFDTLRAALNFIRPVFAEELTALPGNGGFRPHS